MQGIQIGDAHYLCAAAQHSDPLGADAELAALPGLNARRDVPGLWRLQRRLTDRALDLLGSRTLSDPESLAVMRDLGIVLGSVKRHGTEPLEVTPELAPALLALGWQTHLIPRDTVQHYTSWNPDGERRRRYTDDPQERTLQEAVSVVYPQLSASLAISAQVAQLDPRDARFAPLLVSLNALVVGMVSVIDEVVREVSPQFFAQTLRPYFEEVTVAGTTYLGPAAAQVPLWLVDLCLWASDRNSDGYRLFVGDSLPYALPSWRAFYDEHQHRPSVVTRLTRALHQPGPNRQLEQSAAAAAAVLRTLKTFRGRHLGIARKAYDVDVRLYENGSGGAPVQLLKEIIDLTRDNESLVVSRPASHHRPPVATTPAGAR